MKPSEILTRAPIEPRWIVHDILPRGTLTVLAGAPGAGKSTLCYALSYAVALGRPFLGHSTEPTKVLYFDEENGPDFLPYNQWTWAGLGCPDPLLLDPMLQLEHYTLAAHWQPTLFKTVTDFQPGLIIIDTAGPAFHVLDENDNSEATQIIQRLRHCQRLVPDPPAILILKHERHSGHEKVEERTIRGAKTWLGAVDQVLYHVGIPGKHRDAMGARSTRLLPGKVRAFGLRHPILITPEWKTGDPKGLILHGKDGA